MHLLSSDFRAIASSFFWLYFIFWLYFLLTLLHLSAFQLSILSEVYYLNFLRQSPTPVLLCTTKYYSSTTLYYKVLLCTTQYYNVLLQYYPVLPCTATYYSSTTLYYKVLLCTTQCYNVLLQYYLVLQSTTPVLPCTAKYYSSTTLYYTVLQRTTPVLLCTTKQHSWLFLDTYEPLFTWLMSVWNVIYVIYNGRSNRSHPPTSPNTAPATQNESHDWSASHMKRHLQCAEQQESQSNFTKYCACHAKWISWLIRVTDETSFTMRGATGIIPQLHQILRLPRKMNLMIDPHHIWNVIYNARSKQSHPPTSRNTAPATQNESHDWSASHMKRHLQCAEQQTPHHNFTKYCACHAKWISWLIRVTYETSFTMRGATNFTPQLHQILRLPRNLQVPDFSGNSMNCFRQ